MRQGLLARDWIEHELAPIVGPAGLDIGAVEPAEIAISILAELIVHRRQSTEAPAVAPAAESADAASERPASSSSTAIDPVCGMEVRTEDARFSLELENRTYYFCCEGCLGKFTRDAAAVE